MKAIARVERKVASRTERIARDCRDTERGRLQNEGENSVYHYELSGVAAVILPRGITLSLRSKFEKVLLVISRQSVEVYLDIKEPQFRIGCYVVSHTNEV